MRTTISPFWPVFSAGALVLSFGCASSMGGDTSSGSSTSTRDKDDAVDNDTNRGPTSRDPDGTSPTMIVQDAGMSIANPMGVPSSVDLSAGCFQPAPSGGQQPSAPKAYSGGQCPNIQPGMNTIRTRGGNRKFMLIVPEWASQANIDLPTVFLWHWLTGTAEEFAGQGLIQVAANTVGFMAVIPDAKGDLPLQWPYTIIDPQSRYEEELAFFDDLLACVSEQYKVNHNCVSSAGVSAGGLWTSVLAGERSEYLSSFLSLSGGAGASGIRPFANARHKLAGYVLWGGPSDTCGINFQDTSRALESSLQAGGHFFVECVHNCRHGVPPLESLPGNSPFDSLFDFVVDHPYWLPDGDSPYKNGMPDSMPDWCGIGKGSAHQRTGACMPPAC